MYSVGFFGIHIFTLYSFWIPVRTPTDRQERIHAGDMVRNPVVADDDGINVGEIQENRFNSVGNEINSQCSPTDPVRWFTHLT